jgi:hypothetical protein
LEGIGVPPSDLSVVQEVAQYSRDTGRTEYESLRFWAIYYQPELRKVLAWLAEPQSNRDLGPEAVRFLQAHSAGISWNIDEANDNFDETGNDGAPIYFWPSLGCCQSVMSPLCRFLVDRIWEFQEGELDLREAIPLRTCGRRGCHRFKVPERQKDKCFCSDACRAIEHQNQKSSEEKAAYMRKYRETLNKMSGIQLRRGRRRR